jgi:hypothetical protein
MLNVMKGEQKPTSKGALLAFPFRGATTGNVKKIGRRNEYIVGFFKQDWHTGT